MAKRGKKSSVGTVRPTTQKILESLSGVLMPRLEGARVLDLFAGTGSVGLRLLEEGAKEVVFVEAHRRVAGSLRKTVRQHERSDDLSVVTGMIPSVLEKVKGLYQVVVCDPPYDWECPESLLPAAKPLVEEGGILVVEHHHKTLYEEQAGWRLERRSKFGETRLSFFERVTCS